MPLTPAFQAGALLDSANLPRNCLLFSVSFLHALITHTGAPLVAGEDGADYVAEHTSQKLSFLAGFVPFQLYLRLFNRFAAGITACCQHIFHAEKNGKWRLHEDLHPDRFYPHFAFKARALLFSHGAVSWR